jgi:hypothetical protein
MPACPAYESSAHPQLVVLGASPLVHPLGVVVEHRLLELGVVEDALEDVRVLVIRLTTVSMKVRSKTSRKSSNVFVLPARRASRPPPMTPRTGRCSHLWLGAHAGKA